jgi:hypothetical protein
VKEFMKRAKAFLAGMAVGIGAILIIVITALVRQRRSVKTSSSCERSRETKKAELQNEFTALAESKRQEAVDAVRATPPRTVAERYEGVGEAVNAGRNRFASRVKNRVFAAGGRRIDEQRTD